MLAVVVAALAGLTVLSLAVGVRTVVISGAGNLSGRLNRYGVADPRPVVDQAAQPKAKRRLRFTMQSERLIQELNKAVEKQNFAENLRKRLARADLKITVGEFLIINASSTVVGGALGFALFGTPVYFLVFMLAGLILPHWYLRIRTKQRFKKFQNQLADTIAMLSNSLRSGYSILSAMDLVSKEMGPPVSDEFHRVTAEIGLGLAPEEALSNLMRRIRSEDLLLMITAMNIQRDVGGNLAQILDIIANTIRERVKLQGEIKALTAQQTLAGYIITALPLLLAVVIYFLDPPYISTFWTWNKGGLPCGLIMAGTSIFFMVVGFFAMRKIVAIEV
jgi:tight adherence protein B